jgi:hypothetical protein
MPNKTPARLWIESYSFAKKNVIFSTCWSVNQLCNNYITVKVEVKSVLRVRTSNVNIAQISNVSNFSEHKLYFIFI